MKRSIIDVFPTPVSPRKTSLNLVSQRLVLYYIRLAFPASIIQDYYKEKSESEHSYKYKENLRILKELIGFKILNLIRKIKL